MSVNAGQLVQRPQRLGSDAVRNDSGVSGTHVTDALDNLNTSITAAVDGLNNKGSAVALADANIDLTSATDPNPIDGVTVTDGQVVLLNGQSTGTENGLYTAVTATDPTTWTRTSNFDAGDSANAAYVYIREGSTYADTRWWVEGDDLTVGTDAITWTQFSGAAEITAGTGLQKSGNTLSVSAVLQSIDGLTTAADEMIYTTASDTYAVTALTPFARTLLDDADAATARTTLGAQDSATAVTAAIAATAQDRLWSASGANRALQETAVSVTPAGAVSGVTDLEAETCLSKGTFSSYAWWDTGAASGAQRMRAAYNQTAGQERIDLQGLTDAGVFAQNSLSVYHDGRVVMHGNATASGTLTITDTTPVSGTSASAEFSGGIYAAGGIGFGDEALQDYDEGTWTPTIEGSSTAGTQTYSTQSGRYTRVGDMCYIEASIVLTALDGATAGIAVIEGLPFARNNAVGGRTAFTIANMDNITFASQIMADLNSTETRIALKEVTTSGVKSNVTASDLSATSEIHISGWYPVE